MEWEFNLSVIVYMRQTWSDFTLFCRKHVCFIIDKYLLLRLTSASLASSRFTISSPSGWLEAIISGVQPEPSYKVLVSFR